MKKLLVALLGFLCPGLLAAAPDDKQDLAAAGRKIVDANSLAFRKTTESVGDAKPSKQVSEGKYEKNVGLHLRFTWMSEIETYRKGDQVVIRNPDGTWRKGNRGQNPRRLWVPQDEAADLETKFQEVRKLDVRETVDGVECAVYEGTLTEAAAAKLVHKTEDQEILAATAKAWIVPGGERSADSRPRSPSAERKP